MPVARITPQAELLLQRFSYERPTGGFTWLVRASTCIQVGDPAGCWVRRRHHLRRMVQVDGVGYYSARLIWRMMTGDDPGLMDVDHINGDTTDERWENLRLVTRSGTCRNSRKQRNGDPALPKGVCFRKAKGRYEARIRFDGRRHFLGYFDDPAEAGRAYDEAAKAAWGDVACVGQEAIDRLHMVLTPPARKARELPRGVYFHKLTGRYCAQIRIDGQQCYLGLFDDPEDAARARATAAAARWDENTIWPEGIGPINDQPTTES